MEKRRNSKKQRNLIAQGGMMAVMSLLVSACLVLRRIPLTMIWGDEGNGIYGAAYALFTLCWLLCSYGLPMALPGLLRPGIKKGHYLDTGRMMRIAFLYAGMISGILGVLLFLGSDLIARSFLYEPLASLPLRIMAPALLFLALGGVLRGFFLGNGAGFPVMISWLIEQAVALSGGLFLTQIQKGYGVMVGALLQNESFHQSFAVMGFAGGILAGALLSFLFLLCIYLLSHGYYGKRGRKSTVERKEGFPRMLARFLVTLLPVIVYGFLTRGYIAIQQICFRLFTQDVISAAAITRQWGVYEGKDKVFTMLPVILSAAMGLALCDRVSSLRRREAWPHIRDLTRSALKAAMIVVIPLSVMAGTLAVPLLNTFFPGQDVATGSRLLLYGFATGIFFSAACLLAQALLGLAETMLVLSCGIAAFAIHIGALYGMLKILQMDIVGVLYADIIYAFCLLLFIGAAARRKCGFRYGLLRSMTAPLAASLVMGILLYFLSGGLSEVMPPPVLLAVLAVGGVMVYTVILLLLRGTTEKELRLVPGGRLLLAAGKAMRML